MVGQVPRHHDQIRLRRGRAIDEILEPVEIHERSEVQIGELQDSEPRERGRQPAELHRTRNDRRRPERANDASATHTERGDRERRNGCLEHGASRDERRSLRRDALGRIALRIARSCRRRGGAH